MRFIKKFLLKVILEDAIAAEEAAYTFYESALETALDPESVTLLKKLMAGEFQHRMKLEELQKQGCLEPDALSEEVPVDIIQEVDRPREIRPGSSLQDILHIALHKEQWAANHYTRLYENVSLRIVKDVFWMLSQEEAQHVLWIKEQLEQIS